MTINAETQTIKLTTMALSKFGNSYSPKIYKPGTLPQFIVDRYPDKVEVIVDVDSTPVEKKGVVNVGEKMIIAVEATPLSQPKLPEQKVVEQTRKAKIASKTTVVNPAE